VLLGAFMDQLAAATPLPVGAEIRYLKLAWGDIEAEAVLGRPAEDVRAELAEGGRPEFDIAVAMRRADGETVAEMTVRWTLRPNG
jgi:hypothetical protein